MNGKQQSIPCKQDTVRRMKTTPIDEAERERPGKTARRLDMLLDVLREAMQGEFTGYIKVNYSQGSIGRVEKFEEILRR